MVACNSPRYERDDPGDGRMVDAWPHGRGRPIAGRAADDRPRPCSLPLTLCLKSVFPGAGGWANQAHCDGTLSASCIDSEAECCPSHPLLVVVHGARASRHPKRSDKLVTNTDMSADGAGAPGGYNLGTILSLETQVSPTTNRDPTLYLDIGVSTSQRWLRSNEYL